MGHTVKTLRNLILYLVIAAILVYVITSVDQAALFFNALLMIGIPLVLGLLLARKLKVDMGLFGIGAMTFVASQIFHIPFNIWALNPVIKWLDLQPASGNLDLAILGLLFGLSAGVFEETARYLVYRWQLVRNRTWEEGLMFGAGHGGIEAIILGLFALWGFLQLATFRDLNPEALVNILSPEKAELIQSYLSTYESAPWYYNFLGTVERLATIAIHLSATLLILQTYIRKNIGWYILAVLWHTLVDAFAVYGIQTWNVYMVEGIIVLFGICSVGIIFALRKGQRKPEEEAESRSEPLLTTSVKEDEITSEKLENSRYE
jgi:uncharacterized membrane protein YhfC